MVKESILMPTVMFMKDSLRMARETAKESRLTQMGTFTMETGTMIRKMVMESLSGLTVTFT